MISSHGSTLCLLGSLLCALCPSLCALGDTKPGLDFSVSEHGLGSLLFNGQSLLASPDGGELQSAQSLFRKANDAVIDKPASPAARSHAKDAVDLTYPWGNVSCAYSKKGENEIVLHIGITNSSKGAISDVSLRLMELNFPSVPEGMQPTPAIHSWLPAATLDPVAPKHSLSRYASGRLVPACAIFRAMS